MIDTLDDLCVLLYNADSEIKSTHEETPLTKRQANTIMALGVAILLTQILCTAVLVSRMDSATRPAASAVTEAMEVQAPSTVVESSIAMPTQEEIHVSVSANESTPPPACPGDAAPEVGVQIK